MSLAIGFIETKQPSDLSLSMVSYDYEPPMGLVFWVGDKEDQPEKSTVGSSYSYVGSYQFDINSCMGRIKMYCHSRIGNHSNPFKVIVNNRIHRELTVNNDKLWKSYMENILFGMGFANHKGLPTLEQVLHDDYLIFTEDEVEHPAIITMFLTIYRQLWQLCGIGSEKVFYKKMVNDGMLEKYPHVGFLQYTMWMLSRGYLSGDNSSFNRPSKRNLAEIAPLSPSHKFILPSPSKDFICGTNQTRLFADQAVDDKDLVNAKLFDYDLKYEFENYGTTNYSIEDIFKSKMETVEKNWLIFSKYLEKQNG